MEELKEVLDQKAEDTKEKFEVFGTIDSVNPARHYDSLFRTCKQKIDFTLITAYSTLVKLAFIIAGIDLNTFKEERETTGKALTRVLYLLKRSAILVGINFKVITKDAASSQIRSFVVLKWSILKQIDFHILIKIVLRPLIVKKGVLWIAGMPYKLSDSSYFKDINHEILDPGMSGNNCDIEGLMELLKHL